MLIKNNLQILIFLIFTESCATLISPSIYPIYVDTLPVKAKAFMMCDKERLLVVKETPATFLQTPKEECVVKISKEGYSSEDAKIEKKINPAFWGNIWLFIFLMPIDLISGHWQRPENGIIEVKLKKNSDMIDNKK